MIRLFRPKPTFGGRQIAAFVGFCLLLCLLGIVILGINLRNGLLLQASAQSDNTQWTFSQLDVEYVYLATAIEVALQDPQKLAEVRKRFDIFYNRATILRQGKLFFPLQEDPVYQAGTANIQAFLRANLGAIDGADRDLQAALPQMFAGLPVLQQAVKDVVATGINVFAEHSDAQRFKISYNLLLLAMLTAIVVSLLMILSLSLLKLNQINNDRAAQIQMTLARTETIVTAAIDAVLVIDSDGIAREFNPAAERMFGYRRDEILGKPAGFLFPSGGLDLNKALLNGFASRNRNRRSGVRRDGQVFPLEVSVVAGRDADGPIFVAYLRDLSDELANAQALHQARDDAKATERTKADLLAVMSHEMRTPLNGMMGMIELLDDTPLTPEQSRYVRAMQNSGEILLHHVEDVLNIAKLESGAVAVHYNWVNLPDLVGEVFDTQSATGASRGNRLHFRPAASMPTLIRSDEFLLRQILTNLISNANKFTQNGVITVAAQPDLAKDAYALQVIDTGIGIASKDRKRIFEDFVTLDASYTRNTGGTGLGLGIVRRIVETLGGTIDVDVNPSGGSIFRISLPQTAPLRKNDFAREQANGTAHQIVALPQPTADLPAAPPLRILVAEDNEINRMLLRELIAKLGYQVTEAHDGRDAVTMAMAAQYDLIFMDISMPRLDGIAASQLIRNSAGPNQTTPIVALTAHAFAQDRDRMVAAGVQDLLIKPISGAALAAIIAKLHPRADKPALLPDITAELRAVLGHDRYDRTMRTFAREAVFILDAPEPKPSAETCRELHKLCGAAAMLGAAPFAASLKGLQDCCEQQDADLFHQLWPQTAQAWRRTLAAINAELAQSRPGDQS